MGYPMTWQRLVSRNGLQEGDYDELPFQWAVRVNTNREDDGITAVGKIRRERLREYERQVSMLVGDVRRLERDAKDEGAVCAYIAHRTGVAADNVAAVLKEFIDW